MPNEPENTLSALDIPIPEDGTEEDTAAVSEDNLTAAGIYNEVQQWETSLLRRDLHNALSRMGRLALWVI